ncbi:MAG: SprT family zinc-dependent metalloprotease [Burkholderiales bacterium]
MRGQLSLFDDFTPEAGRTLRFGERVVAFRFARTRRRTIAIAIDVTGLSVRAPRNAPWREIESFLYEKQRWILTKLEEWGALPRPSVIRGTTGERLPLFGESTALEVRAGRSSVGREAGQIVVTTRQPLRGAVVVRLLTDWLKQQALAALTPRAAHYAARLELAAPPVALSHARTQWGVCTEGGSIRLNWRLVHLEPELADYVVAHEVAHLRELNHSKRFWNLLEKLYPEWREARERLEFAGAALPQYRGTR